MTIKHISVSQFKTYEDCPKKWYIEKIVGIRKPGTTATRFGTKFHEFMEEWVANGTGDYPKIPKYMEPFLNKSPEFFQWLATLKEPKIEEEINYVLPASGIPFIGYIDLQSTRGIIEDYKTVGDWKWALKEAALYEDVQMNMYAFVKKTIDVLIHYQFNKKTHGMKTVTAAYNPLVGQAVHDKIDMAAIKMSEDSEKPIEDILKNTNSCGKFGGCPFKDYCSNQCSIKELKVRVENPHVKERGQEELINMEPQNRLAELASEIMHNQSVTKKKGVIMSKLQELRENQKKKREAEAKLKEEASKTNDKQDTDTNSNDSGSTGGSDTGANASSKPAQLDEQPSDPVAGEVKEKKKRTRKTKATKTVNDKPLVFVDCRPLGCFVPTATEILQPNIDSVLTTLKVPCLSAIQYNEGIQMLAKHAESLLDTLKAAGDFKLDMRLPCDVAVYSWIFQFQKQNEFMIIK